jgi:excisionase family DNA binding protein
MTTTQNQAETHKVCYSVSETAKMLSVSTRTVWTIVRSGQIGFMRIGQRVLIPAASLQDYIDKNVAAAAQGYKPYGK